MLFDDKHERLDESASPKLDVDDFRFLLLFCFSFFRLSLFLTSFGVVLREKKLRNVLLSFSLFAEDKSVAEMAPRISGFSSSSSSLSSPRPRDLDRISRNGRPRDVDVGGGGGGGLFAGSTTNAVAEERSSARMGSIILNELDRGLCKTDEETDDLLTLVGSSSGSGVRVGVGVSMSIECKEMLTLEEGVGEIRFRVVVALEGNRSSLLLWLLLLLLLLSRLVFRDLSNTA